MINYNDALEIVLKNSKSLGVETLPLEKTRGCFLAKDISSKHNIPFFDNSAVDGFGVKIEDISNASIDTPVKLNLIDTVKAGDDKKISLKHGSTVKILTGAQIPFGVEAVVMKEFCECKDDVVYVSRTAKKWENIRREGEEIKYNEKINLAGAQLTPPIIGLLATLGFDECLVNKKPKISVIVTGSELIKPGKKLSKGKIYESNSYAVAAALEEIGVEEINTVIVKDDKKLIKKTLLRELKKSDVIITIGGISVGDYDFVKEIFNSIKVKTLFTEVAIKPAKPNYFGVFTDKKKNKKLVFGLPGNPVSALISFHQLLKPSLLKVMGAKSVSPFKTSAVLDSDIYKKPGRLEFVRGKLEVKNGSLVAVPSSKQGSHMLSGIANANALIYFPAEKEKLEKGNDVSVEFLQWN